MGSDDRVSNWLDEAHADLKSSEVLIQGERFNAAVFHCQQAAEKAMKALLLSCHKAPWGHSVWNLYLEASECLKIENQDVEKAAKTLDFHYISSRYPDAFPSGTAAEHYDLEDAKGALTWAKRVMEFVMRHL